MSDNWPDLAAKMKVSLAEGLDVAGTVDDVEILTHVGQVGVDIIIEVSDLKGADQREAYAVLCDLLHSRLASGADQVLGCLLFAGDADADALAVALDGMVRSDRQATFTPVVPLGREQAEAMAESEMTIDEIIDPATDLIAAAADHRPPTAATAETLLSELDELIERHLT